jgi:hypothetical protein
MYSNLRDWQKQGKAAKRSRRKEQLPASDPPDLKNENQSKERTHDQ